MTTQKTAITPEAKNGEANSTEMAIVDKTKTELSTKVENKSVLESFDLTKGMPDLNNLEVLPLNLMSGYWTPKEKGELKRVLFDRIETVEYVNEDSGEVKQLECAFFYEGTGTGTKDAKVTRISNGSKRLVSVVKNLQPGTAIQITYLGKKKNATNTFSSDDWDVFPLKTKAPKF